MKISIVTTAYNSETTIRDTIESVLAQTYPDIEYIIKDGGSKDATLAICKEYEPKFNGRMKIMSYPDNGIYDGMNQGIEAATGDVVGLLNSDDFYTSNDVLQSVADTFSYDESLDAVYGDVHFVKDVDLTRCVRYYSSALFERGWMRLGFMPAHPSFYCKKECYEKFGYFDTAFKVAADFENLLRLIYKGKIKTKYIKKDFVSMRTGGASTAGFASRKTIMKEHIRGLRKNGIYSNFLLLSLRYFYKIFELIRR